MVRSAPFVTLCVALATVGSLSAADDAAFFFKDGDRVVMIGDSITEQHLYSNYVEMWTVTRFPHWNLTFRNSGIGGDTSGGGNARFKRDVLPFKPTALTVDFGMNDGGYQPFNEKRFMAYMKGLQGIADQARAAEIRVAWITPQPVEHYPNKDEAKEAYNQTLEKFGDGVREIAAKNGGLFADQFHPYWAVIQKARDAGEKGRITAGDAVHPGPPGQALMAASILKAMSFPKAVASVAVSPNGIEARNCRGDKLAFKEDLVSFERTDSALPFFPEQARGILKWTPLLEDMNDYRLSVSGLRAGKYEVKLGGKKVAEYSDRELAAGVNLAAPALAAGPVADQVKEVVKAVEAKTNYYHDQIYSPLVLRRGLDKNPDFKDVAKEAVDKRREALIAERLQKLPEYDAAIRQALQPRAHTVEVAPAK